MLQILNVFSQTKSKETGKIYIVDILVEKNHGVKKRKIVISQHFLLSTRENRFFANVTDTENDYNVFSLPK